MVHAERACMEPFYGLFLDTLNKSTSTPFVKENAVLLRSSRNPATQHYLALQFSEGWVDNDFILILGGIYPLNIRHLSLVLMMVQVVFYNLHQFNVSWTASVVSMLLYLLIIIFSFSWALQVALQKILSFEYFHINWKTSHFSLDDLH